MNAREAALAAEIPQLKRLYGLRDNGYFQKLYTGAWETVPRVKVTGTVGLAIMRVMIFFDHKGDKRFGTAQCVGNNGELQYVPIAEIQNLHKWSAHV